MHPPIASPHPVAPSSAPYPATVGQWIYALVCAALCCAVVYLVFGNVRQVLPLLRPLDCGTGRSALITQAMMAPLACVFPVSLLACVNKTVCAPTPLRLMRFCVVACVAVSAALVGLMLLLSSTQGRW